MICRCRPLLGTFVEVTAPSQYPSDAAFDAIERVHRLMSAHDPESDLSRLNRSGHERPVQVDPWTAAVLERALFWSKESEGAFDCIAAGATAVERGNLSLHAGQPAPLASHWSWLEVCGRSARLLKPGCVDLGGIAKGFAVDRALAAMKASGAESGLVNAGGDIGGFGPHPWPVQVVRPSTRQAVANVAVSNGAIATSSVLPDGSGNHLLHRATGIVSATICAPNAMDADALAKIVLSQAARAAACLAIANAQAFILTARGSIRTIEPERRAA